MTPTRNRNREQLLESLAELARDPRSGEETYLKSGDVAMLFGITDRSVRQWADDGRLPCLRTRGKHRLFPANAVIEALRRTMPDFDQLNGHDA